MQVARSGKQNIPRASITSNTSKETEIKLTNPARASLEELMIDYPDLLRPNKLTRWDKNNRLSLRFQELNHTLMQPIPLIRKPWKRQPINLRQLYHLPDDTVSYLLKQQLETLEMTFINEDGLRERMTRQE